ncbi:MAG: mechanosensitive ion channel family protein [bacterium]
MDPIISVEEIVYWAKTSGLKILVVIAFTLVVIKGVRILSSRLAVIFSKQFEDEEAQKRAWTLSLVIRHSLTVLILVVAVITVLGQLGVQIGPVLAAAGIAGLAVGFGAQSLVKDVINGFFILLQDQIRVGDVVEIAGKSGLVEKVNLKMTVLRDFSGNVHFVPNGNIDVVTNMTKDYSCYLFEIGVAYRENVDEVMEVIREVDEELRSDPNFKELILKPIEIFGLDKFGDSALIIRARTTTLPIKQWTVAREFNRRLKQAFDARGIEIPFPHITLYMGEDKKGEAPPLRVAVKSQQDAGS